MKTEPICVLPDDTVQTAAQRMRDENIGFLPVCDVSGKVIGTLTDRDIAIRLVARALPASTRAAEVMTQEVVACRQDDDLRLAEGRMQEAQKSRIICTDAQGRLIGVISLSDIARSEPADRAAATLRAVAMREAVPVRTGRPPDPKSERAFQRIEQSGTLPAGLDAPGAVRAVLCVLAVQLSGGQADVMASSLPPTLRDIVQPCAMHRNKWTGALSSAEFTQALAHHLQTTEEGATAVIRAVFSAVQAEMPAGERDAVEAQLHTDLKALWDRRQAA